MCLIDFIVLRKKKNLLSYSVTIPIRTDLIWPKLNAYVNGKQCRLIFSQVVSGIIE